MPENKQAMYITLDTECPKKNYRKPKKLVPPTEKNDRYWERRCKNNEAARKSRENKRHLDFSMRQRISYLEELNKHLEKENNVLKTENEVIKHKFQLPLDEIFLGINEAGQLIGERWSVVLPEQPVRLPPFEDYSMNSSYDSYLDSPETQDSLPDSNTSVLCKAQPLTSGSKHSMQQSGSPSMDSHSEDSSNGQAALVIDEGHIPVKKRRNKLINDSGVFDLSISGSQKTADNGYSTDISSSESSVGDVAVLYQQSVKEKAYFIHKDEGFNQSQTYLKHPGYFLNQDQETFQSLTNHFANLADTSSRTQEIRAWTSEMSENLATGGKHKELEGYSRVMPMHAMQVSNQAHLLHRISQDHVVDHLQNSSQAISPRTHNRDGNCPQSHRPTLHANRWNTGAGDTCPQEEQTLRERLKVLEEELQKVKHFVLNPHEKQTTCQG